MCAPQLLTQPVMRAKVKSHDSHRDAIQGRFAKSIFVLQMHRNIVSLNKLFGRHRFQTALLVAANR